MLRIIQLLIVLSFSLFAKTTLAEDGCPPGQYPQAGQGWQTCVPIPGYDTGQTRASNPRINAPDRWQALAGDSENGILGTSANAPTRADAEAAALDDCRARGGSSCKVKISQGNGCVAMTVGDRLMNTTAGHTKKEAEDNGLKECEKSDAGCKIYYSACN